VDEDEDFQGTITSYNAADTECCITGNAGSKKIILSAADVYVIVDRPSA
jgi:hypothetical protein